MENQRKLLQAALNAVEEANGDTRIFNEILRLIELHDNFGNSEELIRERIEANQGVGIKK
jgi:hypothetical protein